MRRRFAILALALTAAGGVASGALAAANSHAPGGSSAPSSLVQPTSLPGGGSGMCPSDSGSGPMPGVACEFE